LSPGGVPSEVFATEHSLKLNGATIGVLGLAQLLTGRLMRTT